MQLPASLPSLPPLSLLSSLLASGLSLATPGALAAVCASLALLQALRLALADADLSCLAAVRSYPARGAFKGQTVLITGASSGIGEALAKEFARGGADLILCARRVAELVRVADACLAEGAPSAEALRLDVTEHDSHAAIIAHVLRKHPGGVHILVNNAGRSQRGLVERTPLSVDRALLELNVLSVLSFTKALLVPTLEAGRPLHIVNTSSVAGKLGSPISAAYSASKHALQGFFDSMRMELAHRGIRVTNCCPGPVRSEIAQHAFTEQPGQELGVKEEAGSRMPAERCALLMAAATHAGLEEVWLAQQPILFFVYMAQYCRWLYFLLGPSVGKKRVEGLQRGESGYSSISSASALFGGKKKE